jgi:anti-sigma factor RsiW
VTHELWTAQLDAYLDGELESGELAKLDSHLRECPGCAAEGLRRLQWKRNVQSAAAQRYVADPKLRERIQKNISREKPVRRWWPAYAVIMAVVLLLAGIAVLREGSRQERNNRIISELADLHVSTLASSTPVDVLSTDPNCRARRLSWWAGG